MGPLLLLVAASCILCAGTVLPTSPQNTNPILLPKPYPVQPECGAYQEYSSCGSSCPDSCDNLDDPDRVCTDQCVAGCFCVDGFVLDAKQRCIPPKFCPRYPPRCGGKGKEWDDCGSSCPDSCDNINDPHRVCTDECVPGCFCKEGLVLNDKGNCVFPDKCGKPPPKCGPNKVWSSCGSSCPDSCDNLDDPDRICTDQCVAGCFCTDGFVLNKNGDCVTPDKCGVNQVCGPNEVGRDCRVLCPPQTCASLYALFNCLQPQPCEPGCDCRPGYLRTVSGGVCQPSERCSSNPSNECPVNEQYEICGTVCPKTCRNKDVLIKCIAACKTGCFCRTGWVRNDAGVCVEPSKCPSNECPVNEQYEICGTVCPKTCKNKDVLIKCIAACKTGCFCRTGWVRNDTGVCVEPSKCPANKCPVNEQYKTCGTACPKTCKNKDIQINCIALCKEGCFCREGWVRNDDGLCVEPSQCQCSTNETYSNCTFPCPPNTCAARATGNQPSCPGQQTCEKGCLCKEGYTRDDNNRCIKIEDCGCPANEIYSQCYYPCPPESCASNGKTYRCPFQNANLCQKGCRCQKGYLRDRNGTCIKAEQCPAGKCPAKEEEYVDCVSGQCKPKTCAELTHPAPCPRVKPPCAGGCLCTEGFLRSSKGQCIPEEQCGCPKNETLNKCFYSCPPETCAARGKSFGCPAQTPFNCEKGCRCNKGYYRNVTGNCVTDEDCGCPKNETFDHCYQSCPPETCNAVGLAYPCPPKQECNAGCRCNKGYRRERDLYANCVKIEDCPPKCPANEVYKLCMPKCTVVRCNQLGKPVDCRSGTLCERGCICREGYLRGDGGICVPKEQCPNPKCGPNQVVSSCAFNCTSTDYCPVDDVAHFPCSPPFVCNVGCVCKPGYKIDAAGNCIPPEKCPAVKCTRRNEVYDHCSSPCRPEYCLDRGNPPPTTCNKTDCQSLCVCKKGHYRSRDGICIPEDQCPPIVKCPVDEVYVECAIAYCSPKTCAELTHPAGCPFVVPPCAGGCLCRQGLLRNSKGVCIPEEQCGCPKNQTFNKCFYLCPPNTCAAQGKDITCPPTNKDYCEKGCRCSEGYLSGYNRMCVKSEDCPRSCPTNETYSDCVQSCPSDSCAADGEVIVCALDADCKKGCRCSEGYRRNDRNMCVKTEECPPKQPKQPSQCPLGETYYSCGTACPVTCANRRKPPICPKICVPGCFCPARQIRDTASGKCVDPSKCPPNKQCPRGEIYKTCGTACPATCANRGLPIGCTKNCVSGCFCPAGQIRDTVSGKCVEPSKCVGCGGDPYAVSGCSNYCGHTCTDYNIEGPHLCPLFCRVGGCACGEGRVYDENKKRCVLPKDCSNTCNGDQNAELVQCPNPCPATCENPKPLPCRRACIKEGCQCKAGYVLGPNSTCIKPDHCPGNQGPSCPANEVYKLRKPWCAVERCDQVDDPPVCIPESPRVSGCICREGYLRDPKGTCIPKDLCPKRCGDNEEYRLCGSPCPDTCESLDVTVRPVCELQPRCVSGCFCKEGYLHDSKKKCVPKEQCPQQCPTNETYSNCAFTCPTDYCPIGAEPVPVCDAPYPCPGGCVCKPGYKLQQYTKKRRCILESDCPSRCPAGETYKECGSACPPTCVDGAESPPCAEECVPGCFCPDNQLRDASGKCIDVDDCRGCGGDPNGVPGCGNYCGQTCADYKKPGGCPQSCRVGGCACRDGYAYSPDTKKCIPANECPSKCPAGEIYKECGSACPSTCVDGAESPPCAEECVPGCFCPDNQLRDASGKCIDVDDCRGCGGDPNGIPGCDNYCGQTCADYKKPGGCPQSCRVGGCACRDGYAYSPDTKKCIPANDCPTQCPTNQTYVNCLAGCPTDYCPTNDGPQPVCEPPHPDFCKPGCRCQFGYKLDRRSEKPRCILSSDCSPIKCTRQHEKYAACPAPCLHEGCARIPLPRCESSGCGEPRCVCEQGYCRDERAVCVAVAKYGAYGEGSYKCPAGELYSKCGSACPPTCVNGTQSPPCEELCVSGCFCPANQLRDASGNCIDVDKCRGCGGDPNGIPGCSNYCGQTCADYKNPIGCSAACLVGGCACRDSYAYNQDTKTCIPAKDCLLGNAWKYCPPNEEYSSCYYKCPPRRCQDIGRQYRCRAQKCSQGCVCKEGFWRNEDGACVTEQQCHRGIIRPPPEE